MPAVLTGDSIGLFNSHSYSSTVVYFFAVFSVLSSSVEHHQIHLYSYTSMYLSSSNEPIL